MKTTKKSTKGKIAERVAEIIPMILEAKRRTDIIRFGSEKWGITERQVENYITKANNFLKERAEKDMDLNYSKAVHRYEELYRKSLEKKDLKTCVTINEKLAHLQGLDKTQIEHSGSVTFLSNLPE